MHAKSCIVIATLLWATSAGAEVTLTKWAFSAGGSRITDSGLVFAGMLGDAFAARREIGEYVIYTGFRSPDVRDVLDVADSSPRTSHFLYQNFPNPVRRTTTFSFRLAEEQSVRLAIYDVAGRRVRELTRGRYPAGVHTVAWERGAGDGTGAGLYFCRIEAGAFRASRKFVIVN